MNPRLKRDFQKYLEDLNKPKESTTVYRPPMYNNTSRSGYNPNGTFCPIKLDRNKLVDANCGNDDFTMCGSDPITSFDSCSIFFYEWSQMTHARHYRSLASFLEFCTQSGITLTEEDKRMCKFNAHSWVSCLPHERIVATCPTRSGLATILKNRWAIVRERVR